MSNALAPREKREEKTQSLVSYWHVHRLLFPSLPADCTLAEYKGLRSERTGLVMSAFMFTFGVNHCLQDISAALFTCLGVLGMLFAYRDYIRRLNAVRVCRAPELLPASREEATEDIVGLKAIEARVSNCLTALAASYAELVGKRSRTQGALAARREKQDRLEVLEDELRDKKRTRKDSPFRDEFNAALEDLEKRKVAIDVELSHLEGLKKAAAAKIARQRRQLYALRRRIDEYRLLQAYQRETTGVGSIDPELVTSAHDQCASVEEFGERVNAMLDAADTSTRGVDGSLERELATIEKLLTEVANLLPEEPVR